MWFFKVKCLKPDEYKKCYETKYYTILNKIKQWVIFKYLMMDNGDIFNVVLKGAFFSK